MTQYNDGDLEYFTPAQLVDFSLGGNIRRNRKNAESVKADIAKNGIIQPVVVRPNPLDPNTMELLAGYGRRQFASELNLERVPALIRLVDDKQALEIHLAENTQREDITLTDEVEFALRYISFHHGDRKSAALALGWPLTKLNERLELRTCSEAVLSALDNAQIKAGHALILSTFNEQIQKNTLDKIIQEKWSVQDLKVRANKVQIPLRLAKFDKTECGGCAHNSERQGGLFDMDENVEAKCGNNTCFKSKSSAYLQIAKKEATERFGKIIMLSESNAADRHEVNKDTVGANQFEGGCKGCDNRVAVMNDSLTGKTGAITDNQCIDNACYTDCVKSFKAALQKAKKQQSSEEATSDTSSLNPEVKADDNVVPINAEPVKAGKVSQPAIDIHKAELRASSGEHLTGNTTFTLALQLISLISFTGFKSLSQPHKTIGELMNRSEAELQEMIAKVHEYALSTCKSFGSYSNEGNGSAFLTSAAVNTATGADALVTAWKPTQQLLDKYTTVQLAFICEKSGFAETLEETKEGEFTKLKKGKKSEMIKGMLKFPYDWSHFAPDAYLSLMPTTSTVAKVS